MVGAPRTPDAWSRGSVAGAGRVLCCHGFLHGVVQVHVSMSRTPRTAGQHGGEVARGITMSLGRLLSRGLCQCRKGWRALQIADGDVQTGRRVRFLYAGCRAARYLRRPHSREGALGAALGRGPDVIGRGPLRQLSRPLHQAVETRGEELRNLLAPTLSSVLSAPCTAGTDVVLCLACALHC